MRYARRLAAALAVLALVGTAGCFDANEKRGWKYGEAYNSVFESQKVNPDAGDGEPVKGEEGQKAAKAYDDYLKDKAGGEKANKGGITMETTLKQN